MKLLTVRFSPASYQFLSLTSKYLPNHPVLENLQVEVPPLMSEAKLHVRTKLQAGLQLCTQSCTANGGKQFPGPNSGRNSRIVFFVTFSTQKKP